MIVYTIGTSGQALILTDVVLSHFRRHRQTGWRTPEAGGQLFARIDACEVVVVEATGPRGTDRRTRTTYIPDRAAEQAEIVARHAAGLQYVGDWHTHPVREPCPSGRDLDSMAECFVKSTHQLNAFILVIAGIAHPPDGLYVGLHDGTAHHRLLAR